MTPDPVRPLPRRWNRASARRRSGPMGALALGVVAVAGLLVSCGDDEGPEAPANTTAPPTTATTTTLPGQDVPTTPSEGGGSGDGRGGAESYPPVTIDDGEPLNG